MRYLLMQNNTLLAHGPLSIELLSGSVQVLGAPLAPQHKIVVRAEKQAPIHALSDAELEIELGHSGRIMETEGTTIPQDWETAVEALSFMKEGRVLVIGQTDVGKSTLCTYLANRLFSKGISIAVVDADVGQADIGPPATIGITRLQGYISSLGDLEPRKLLFAGHTSPGHIEKKLIFGISRLLEGDEASISIVNTDGWIVDQDAVSYKVRMIESLNPDLVLGLARNSELAAILSGSRARCLILHEATAALKRSQSHRRELRTAGYRRYLDGGSVRALPLGAIRFIIPEDLRVRQLHSAWLRYALLGLLDSDGYAVTIGVLLDLGPEVIRFYSRKVEGIHSIEAGYVRLSPGGEELGFLDV